MELNDVMFDFKDIPWFYRNLVGKKFLEVSVKEQLGRYGINVKVVDVEDVVEKILSGEKLLVVRGTTYLGSVRIKNETNHYLADVVVSVEVKGWQKVSSEFLNDILNNMFGKTFDVEIMDMPVPVLEVSNVSVVKSYVKH